MGQPAISLVSKLDQAERSRLLARRFGRHARPGTRALRTGQLGAGGVLASECGGGVAAGRDGRGGPKPQSGAAGARAGGGDGPAGEGGAAEGDERRELKAKLKEFDRTRVGGTTVLSEKLEELTADGKLRTASETESTAVVIGKTSLYR